MALHGGDQGERKGDHSSMSDKKTTITFQVESRVGPITDEALADTIRSVQRGGFAVQHIDRWTCGGWHMHVTKSVTLGGEEPSVVVEA